VPIKNWVGEIAAAITKLKGSSICLTKWNYRPDGFAEAGIELSASGRAAQAILIGAA